MKKLTTLIFAFVLASSMAFAQNTATNNVYGSGNNTTIEQVGMTNEAFLQLGQDGGHQIQNNTSSITQIGNSNFGKITTESWAGWEPSKAENTISQTGNMNWARTIAGAEDFGGGAFTEITQVGDYNWAMQDQNRSERDASLKVDQTSYGAIGQFSGGAGQVLGAADEGNYAYQNQDQNGTGGYAEAIQDGNGNYVYQNTRKGTSMIYQDGNSNWANNTQNGGNDYADFEQVNGDRNIIDLTQSGNASAEILQDGSDNHVFGLGGLGTVAYSLNGSSLDVTQLGNGNNLYLDQTNGASATVMQNGTTNTSTVIQN